MKTEPGYDVAVIGGGPGGSATAFHLARQGWQVAVFERSRMPRDKACGDGLGPGAVSLLRSMDVDLSGASVIQGVDLRTNGKPSCTSPFRSPAYGLMLPRSALDERVAQRARAAGSTWYEDSRVSGFDIEHGRIVRVRCANMAASVRARFVVVADGGHSALGQLAGMLPRPEEVTGYAVRGYYSNVPVAPDLFRIHLPLTDPQSGRALPGYGWVFPMAGHWANIGVGFFPGQSDRRELNLRTLFANFLLHLREQEPAMADIRPEGRWIGGPLRSGMDPSQCVANGALAVGDAAGLVDPFTGEGVDTALTSGRLAAEVLDVALGRDDPRLLAEYPRLLEHRYRDRFQLGKRFVRTYSFMWKLLQSTVDQDTSLLHSVRRVLFSYNASDMEQDVDAAAPTSPVDGFGTEVQAKLRALASDDLPVFARICLSMQDPGFARLRQVIAFWSHCCGGSEPGTDAVTVATSVELVRLAYGLLTELMPIRLDRHGRHGQTNRWANSFAIMSGNYLLMRAFSAIHRLDPDITHLLARDSAQLCGREIDAAMPAAENSDTNANAALNAAEIEGQFCGLACRAAARVSGCPVGLQEALESFGTRLGAASSLARATTNHSDAIRMVDQAMEVLRLIPDGEPKFHLQAVAAAVVEGAQGDYQPNLAWSHA
ncbi:MAG: geranylgeranyl reductase family protein [Rhodopila sp.]|nr:geranylgeranyl reductase family protein [Rhodopila sp.]